MKRTAEFELGLLGGSLGIFTSFMAIFFEGITSGLNKISEFIIITNALISLLLSILSIIGSLLVRNKIKLVGIFLIVAAVIGFICILIFYILPGIILLLAGLMCFLRKDSTISVKK